MQPTIVLDLDETLIRTSFRQFSVINQFFERLKINFPDYQTYLRLRRKNRLSNNSLVSHFIKDKKLLGDYNDFYLRHIETKAYLKVDDLIVDLAPLEEVARRYDLKLLSLRSNANNSIQQLKNLGLFRFFSDIYFLSHNSIKNPKTDSLKKMNKPANITCFIGDTVSDYEAARANSIRFIAVNTGIYPLNGACDTYPTINDAFKELTQ